MEAKTIKTRINNKWDVYLPEHRAIRPEWPTWEFERLKSMSEHLGPKDTVVYVGAEEGDMCALCAMWGAEIVMIEPNDRVWPNIKLIWAANRLNTPWTFCGFAGSENKNGKVIRGFPECAEGEVIGDHGFKTIKEYPDISQIRIDDIDLPVTAISIDVEGSERRVIEGALETLKTKRPKIWLSGHPEFMYAQYGEYLTELRGLIKSFVYKETLLAYEHEVHFFYEPL